MRNPVEASAYARVGLLGNPSDGYGGKAIAFSLGNFRARVTVVADEGCVIASPAGAHARYASPSQAAAPLEGEAGGDGERLLRAALRRFDLRFPGCLATAGLRIAYETDIPREVGLSGSSAIIIAALRALLRFFDETLSNDELAALALAAEVEELGIAAGPMDRLIQAHEGCLWMDFAPLLRGEAPVHRQLDVAQLPALYVAWDPRGGEASHIVHSEVRDRYERGEPEVCDAMAVFPRLVDEAMARLEAGDHAGFAACVDRNFDTRASIWTLSRRDCELVALGRDAGCGVKQTGSGGAVVGVLRDAGAFTAVEQAYMQAGYCVARPRFVPAGDPHTRSGAP